MRRIIALLSTLLTIALLVAAGGAFWLNATFNKASQIQSETTIVVPRGTGVRGVAALLVEAGIVDDSRPFLLMLRYHGMDRSLKAGEFLLPAQVSPRQAAEILVKGETVKRFFTVPEGLSSFQIIERLKVAQGLTDEIPDNIVEGSLLPETYQFSFGEPVQDLIARMATAHDEALQELWAKRADNLPVKTMEEAVILASIVEKETAVGAERGLVAGVFVNRLRKGMRLQSDPTVTYAMTRGKPLGRALTRKDWKFQDPYNTYVAQGLPPGPICHPGRASLAAVLNPTATKALYFVADGTGGHAFSTTLKEHNRNVAKWRRLKRSKSQ